MPPSVMDPDEYWVELLDVVYAHVVLWDSVLPCPAAICLWLSCLVEYEVSRFFPLRCLLGSDDLQEGIIGTARLRHFSEEQLNDWFSVFGVPHAKIRACVRPYATISWVHSFPRYTVGLGRELAIYKSVVVSMLALEGGTWDSLGMQEPARAFVRAGEVFDWWFTAGHLLVPFYEQLYSCLVLERLAAMLPLYPLELYKLLALDSAVYILCTPIPRHDTIVCPLPGGFNQDSVRFVEGTLRHYNLCMAGAHRSSSLSTSSDASSDESSAEDFHLPAAVFVVDVPAVEGVGTGPAVHGRSRGCPRGCLCGSGHNHGCGRSVPRSA
jgi:hypothetical protein